LARLAASTGEPVIYADGDADTFPEIATALERHAETTHARQILVLPVAISAVKESSTNSALERVKSAARPEFVLVAEQFEGRSDELHHERLAEIARVASTALANALANDQVPFAWLLRPLGRMQQAAAARWPRTVFFALVAAAIVAALVMVQADFNIEATGTLQPAVRRAAFAPRDGIVDAVLVKHGEDVAAGQVLVRLRDPMLELELKRVHGDLETAQRQIEAVRAARSGRAIRDTNAVESYRLSAEERELEQRVANLRRELDLLDIETKKLVVTSSIAGRVLTWNVDRLLLARPVERGEVLIDVADLSADWQLELDVADDRIGHVLAAQQDLGDELTVRFRLSSTNRELPAAEGHVTEVSPRADVNNEPGASARPEVRVHVAFDVKQFDESERRELRPGVSARAEIECGRRRLGYVWFHDVWDAIVSWVRF
jgi:multidrug efflux pump subunit AcrA (membrane-fusion protein)